MSEANNDDHRTIEYVTVFETHDVAAFLAAKSALESAGIPVISPDELSVPGISAGSLDPAGQPGHLKVPAEHAETALSILEEHT